MATMTVKNAAGGDEIVEKPLAPSRAAAASSRPVVLSTEDAQALADILAALIAEQTVNLTKVAGVAVTTGDAPVNVKPTLTATAGVTNTKVRSSASFNATPAKAAAGKIVWLALFNLGTTVAFFKAFNNTGTPDPSVGGASNVPILTLPIPAGGGLPPSMLPAWGLDFSTGVSWAITGAEPDNDETAIAAGQVVGAVGWM